MKIRTAVIGLGQIGQGYDYDLDPQEYILSHCQAIQTHPSFELLAGVDISKKNRQRFEKKFNVSAFNSISDLQAFSLDLLVISTPTDHHLETVKEVVSMLSPKMILIEKPLSYNFKEAKEIVSISKDTCIAVNYIREYEPSHREFCEKLANQLIGNEIKAICWYSKGIMNNGSHFIQLLSNFMGELEDINLISDEKQIWKGIDPEPTLELNYQNGRAYFIPTDEECFTLFEMELIGAKGKVKYYNGGTHYDWWEVVDDPIIDNYRKLETNPKKITTNMDKYQYFVYENIAENIKGERELDCSAKDALETAKILNEIKERLN